MRLNHKLQAILQTGGRGDVIESFNAWADDFYLTPEPAPPPPIIHKSLEVEAFIDAIDRAGLDPFTYSGRCMYGRKCPAVVSEENGVSIGAEILDAALDENKDETLRILMRTKHDNMGRNYVVYYWPNLEWVGEERQRDEDVEDRDTFF